MHNLRSFYYNNKYKIWGIIAFIVVILFSIRTLNRIAKEQNMQKLNSISNVNTSKNNSIISNNSNTFINSSESAVTGDDISKEEIDEVQKIIDQFIAYCNKKELENAYNMLSDECKKVLYQDVNKFKTLYYDKVFNGKSKSVGIENWIGNTYKIKINDDIMSTGKISNSNLQDYYTIVQDQNENKKLNINNFVGTEKINVETNTNNLKINVLYRNIYIDNEEYVLNIENKTNDKVVLDSKKDTKSIYVLDKNEIKYYAYSNELLSNLLSIDSGFSTQLTIKFIKNYSSTSRKDKQIVFSDAQINNKVEEIYIDL